MIAKKSVLGLVHTGGEVRRAPLVGMKFLHKAPVSPADVVAPRTGLQAKDLISLLRRHFAARRRTAILAATPACPCALRVLTPGGKPAVQITFKKRPALRVEPPRQSNKFVEREFVQYAPRFGSGGNKPLKRTGVVVERHLYKLGPYLGLLPL